ncbi:MAG: peptidylprolyl isomerase [Eubacteriales bacterium]
MSKVLATINGREITQDNIDELLYTIPKEEVAKYASTEGQKQLLDELVAQELFYADALDRALDKTKEFLNQLEMTREKLVKSFAISKYLMEFKVTDEEAREYYENNPTQFISPNKVRASHILIDDEEAAKMILKKITAKEITFADAASQYSKCPSKDKEGDLGFFQKGQMVKEFEEAAFHMHVGETNIIKTMYGYHIIVITDQQKSSVMDYVAVLPQIKKHLLSLKQNNAFIERVAHLKEKYTVTYHN